MDKCSGGLDVSERALLGMLGGGRFVRRGVVSDSLAERERLRVLVAENGLENAASGLVQWRAVSSEGSNLAGEYLKITGNSVASLMALQAGNLNDFILEGDVFPGFGTGANDLRIGDIVLLGGQSQSGENGPYQILSLGSHSEKWVLVRVRAEGMKKSSLKRKIKAEEAQISSYDETGSADLGRRYLERSFGSWRVSGFDASVGEACVEMRTGVRISVRVRKTAF